MSVTDEIFGNKTDAVTAVTAVTAKRQREDGDKLLQEVEDFHRRLVAYPTEHARVAAVLWNAHAHAVDAFESTPRLAYLSPEPGSGKTRALEVHSVLVPAPMHAVNATPAALFRAVGGDERPTLLFDEIDTVFGPKAKENEELRALLNAGHRRSGVAYRCIGQGTNQTVQKFPAFAALAVAGLGDLPDTILTRAVVIRMRRRGPREHVEPFRARTHEPEGHLLRERLADWSATYLKEWKTAEPDMPDGVEDRPADVWEPLLAVADSAGGDWPTRARAACLELTSASVSASVSLGVQLLGDLRAVFGAAEAMHTEDILRDLYELAESPWGDLRGKPLDARGLSWRLGSYEIRPTTVRIGDKVLKGYRADELRDAWSRYLPPLSESAVTSVTSETEHVPTLPGVTDVTDVTPPAWKATPVTAHPPEPCEVCGQPCGVTRAGRRAHAPCLRRADGTAA